MIDDSVAMFVDDDLRVLVNVHAQENCRGACPIHRPSDHHMRGWPLIYRFDRGLFERRCPHGVGHPDPDSLAYHVEYYEDLYAGVHGCDGCCSIDHKVD